MRCSTVLLALLAVAACNDGGDQPTSQKPPEAAGANAAAQEAQTVFASRCAVCHGTQGKGDGPAGMSLNPKPRDYSDKAWQASVTDDYLASVIVDGGQKHGKSMMMPPNPDLASKPAVVHELVRIIRSFGK